MVKKYEVVEILGYDHEVTTVNGCDVERFFLDSTKNMGIVSSKILYHGTSSADANAHLMEYWRAPRTYYMFGDEIRYC